MFRIDINARYYSLIMVVCLLTASVVLCTSCVGDISPHIVKPISTNLASIPTLLITAVNYGYVMPTTLHVRAGLLDIALVNNGSEAHQAQVARLNTGVTRDEVLNTLVTQKNQSAAFSLLTFVGGPDTISPGYGQEAILNLPAGQYVLLCFVVGQDGIPHVNKGMLHFFTVSVPVQQSQKNVPQADGRITMQNFRYQLPRIITQSRALTLEVVNHDSEPHEMNIVKLEQGKDVQDVIAFFQSPSGPPPFEELGGFAAIMSGGSGWIKTYLEPGKYALLSIIPDGKTDKPQLTLGMIASFTVVAS